MKALLKKGPGLDNVGLEEIAQPMINDEEIKVKVHATGICGTDIHIVLDEYPADYPVVMGHEYSGIVEEVGGNVSAFKKEIEWSPILQL
ncbi:alcohol dehydrogenase catalytic domain-containing protein [Oceanobacillus sp. 143]|nr:alcohol dehydrogenase catalytic domain-containing protein [Oceanobacillus sp. 143]